MWLVDIRASSWILLSLFVSTASALESDREQPVHIRADSVEIDERQGVSHYRGNVQLDQGTLSIRADRMTVHQTGREIERILIDGTPARFSQLPDDAEVPVEAQARHMTYLGGAGQLELEGEARVEQEGNTFSGNVIVYDTGRSTVKASRSGGEDDERVRVIIQPEKNSSR